MFYFDKPGNKPDFKTNIGLWNSIPVTGDRNGDKKTDIGILDPQGLLLLDIDLSGGDPEYQVLNPFAEHPVVIPYGSHYGVTGDKDPNNTDSGQIHPPTRDELEMFYDRNPRIGGSIQIASGNISYALNLAICQGSQDARIHLFDAQSRTLVSTLRRDEGVRQVAFARIAAVARD